jgi:hypothetical protein
MFQGSCNVVKGNFDHSQVRMHTTLLLVQTRKGSFDSDGSFAMRMIHLRSG